MLTPEQIHALLHEPIYSFDSLTLLSDVEDFLDFSEANIEWQAKRELRSVDVECDGIEFGDPLDTVRYREHRIEGVQYRFNVNLSQRVRYSGLTAVITTIEWSLIALKGRASFQIPAKPKAKNEGVHLLGVFAAACEESLAPQIKELELLTQARNCVVHAAGLIESYDYAAELRTALKGYTGIKISTSNYLGEIIEIDAGLLQAFIRRAKKWLPELEKRMHEKGLLQ